MKKQRKANKSQNQVLLRINPKIYPLEAIYGVCYVFLDKAYIFLSGDPAKKVLITLKGKEKLNQKKLKKLKGEFFNELINYSLRNEIAKRNTKIREYIVGQALFASNPEEFEETLTQEGFTEDPLGIAVPWEEKHKSKRKTRKKTPKSNKKK